MSDSDAMKLHLRNGLYFALLLVSLLFLKTICLSGVVYEEEDQLVAKDQLNLTPNLDVLQLRPTRFKRDTKAVRNLLSPDISDPKLLANDVLISVKTTQKYHETRVKTILETWFQQAKQQTYFFTDASSESLSKETDGHVVTSNCSSSHHRQALCCKMGVELDFFLQSDKSWFCHFDDDNYVNVAQLVELLANYNPSQDWYLGRPSTRDPIQIIDRDNMLKKVSFWFATGGAGFCISKALAKRMAPYTSEGKFVALGDKIRLPDDVTLGYLIEHLLQRPLTVIKKFHSHLESMKHLDMDHIHEQVSLSYGSYSSEPNVVPLDGYFSTLEDPSRLKSLHCYLVPTAQLCQEISARKPIASGFR